MGCDGARSRRGPRRRAFPPVAAGPFVRANGAQRRFKTRRPPCWPGSDAASRESSENDRSHARHSSPNCHPKRSTRPGERRRPPSLSLSSSDSQCRSVFAVTCSAVLSQRAPPAETLATLAVAHRSAGHAVVRHCSCHVIRPLTD